MRGLCICWFFFFSSRRRHTRLQGDWSSDVCSSDLVFGQQWMSWVTLEDVVGILRFAIENAPVRGAINIVSPQPLQNVEFTKVLAKVMRRPALFPAPTFALRLALGEMADALLLSSQRVLPRAIEKLGHRFLHSDLPTALKSLVKTN